MRGKGRVRTVGHSAQRQEERLGRGRDRPVLGKYRRKEDGWKVAGGPLST